MTEFSVESFFCRIGPKYDDNRARRDYSCEKMVFFSDFIGNKAFMGLFFMRFILAFS